MKTNIVFTILISLVLFSCKKSSEKICELNESNFVGVFKVKSVIYKYYAGDPGTDDFLTWDNCRKDDLRHIKADHTILHEDAGMLCFPGGNSTGAWALSGSTIVMNGQSGTVSFFDCNNTSIIFPQSVPNETITLSLLRQ